MGNHSLRSFPESLGIYEIILLMYLIFSYTPWLSPCKSKWELCVCYRNEVLHSGQ